MITGKPDFQKEQEELIMEGNETNNDVLVAVPASAPSVNSCIITRLTIYIIRCRDGRNSLCEGGRVTDYAGGSLNLLKRGSVVASNGKIHEALRELL